MPQSSADVVYRAVRDSAVEFLILLGLWILYVSQLARAGDEPAQLLRLGAGARAVGVRRGLVFVRFLERWL